MKRKPVPAPLEAFPESVRHLIDLDRELLNYMFDHRSENPYDLAQSREFLEKVSEVFTEEQNVLPRQITFGDFILESFETYTFTKEDKILR